MDNLYKDIIDNDDMYFVDRGDIDMFVEHLNEYYSDEDTVYGYEKFRELRPFTLYKIRSYDRSEMAEKPETSETQG